MIEINLLPPEYQRGKMPPIDSIIIVVLPVLIIASLVGIAVGLNGRVKAHETLVETYDKQIIPYRKQYNEIKMAQSRLNVIETRLPIVERLVGGRVLWADKLMEIYKSIPQGIWLQELQMELNKEVEDVIVAEQKAAISSPQDAEIKRTRVKVSPAIRISGLAKSFVELSQFIRNIGSSPLFSEPRFISASDIEFVYPSLLSFNIQTNLVSPTPSEKVKAGREAKPALQPTLLENGGKPEGFSDGKPVTQLPN